MLKYAYDKYGKLLMSALAFARGISPIRIDNLRCLAALYDMGVQQGSLQKAHRQIIRRVQREKPEDQFALTRIPGGRAGQKSVQALACRLSQPPPQHSGATTGLDLPGWSTLTPQQSTQLPVAKLQGDKPGELPRRLNKYRAHSTFPSFLNRGSKRCRCTKENSAITGLAIRLTASLRSVSL